MVEKPGRGGLLPRDAGWIWIVGDIEEGGADGLAVLGRQKAEQAGRYDHTSADHRPDHDAMRPAMSPENAVTTPNRAVSTAKAPAAALNRCGKSDCSM